MNIFSYGRVYSKLSAGQLGQLDISSGVNKKLLFLSKIYFYLFGYPDVASQQRYLMVEKLLRLKKNETIFDAGCGNGIYLQEFGCKFDTSGYGVDIRGGRIASAKKINRFLDRPDVFVKSSLEKVELKSYKFDKAICLEVLEHIEDDGGVLKRLSKSLKKGALFVVSIPIIGTALSKEQENDPNFKPEKYGHVRSGYDTKDIRNLAKSSGLKIVSVQKYFFLVSRNMVKLQQFLYNKKLTLLNLLLSPLLLIISQLDSFIKISPRGYMVVLRKI
jgi:2-polyprenyl-3-methyl-5-hydroxy-6-metoxy-1,4-benzoquinol methylase